MRGDVTSNRSTWLAAALAAMIAGCAQGPAASGGPAGNGSGGDSAPAPGGATYLSQGQVIPTGDACTPTGAHGKHDFTSCKTCHNCGGVVQFDPSGPAVGAGMPLPSFDAAAKTCSNVACHMVPAGNFTYSFIGGDGEPAPFTVPYGGPSEARTPEWYFTGNGCALCHGNPPAYQGTRYAWHSGAHGNQGPTGAMNQCQLCHPDAVSTGGAAAGLASGNCSAAGLPVVGAPEGSVPCSSFHANGKVDVVARFTSACFNCH